MICFILLSCIAPRPLSAQGNTANIDLVTYRAELDRLAQAVDRLEQHPEEAQILRDSLPEKWLVKDEETIYEVSTAPLVEELQKWVEGPQAHRSLELVKHRIRTLQAQADAYAASSTPSNNARRTLQQILARREFASLAKSDWFERMLEKIVNWLDQHMRPPSLGRVNVPSWTGLVLVSIIIGGICLALAYVLWKWVTRTQENLELNLAGGEQFHKQSREWVADALSAARRGDYRSAIRCAYWAAVFRLEELGRWTPNRTLTPREYLRMLPRDHFQRPPLADLTQRFELTWYGYAVATARDFDQVTEQLEKLGCLAPSAAATKES